ncbi:hypothetical protein GN956_G12926 [Arapaima gigas]
MEGRNPGNVIGPRRVDETRPQTCLLRDRQHGAAARHRGRTFPSRTRTQRTKGTRLWDHEHSAAHHTSIAKVSLTEELVQLTAGSQPPASKVGLNLL